MSARTRPPSSAKATTRRQCLPAAAGSCQDLTATFATSEQARSKVASGSAPLSNCRRRRDSGRRPHRPAERWHRRATGSSGGTSGLDQLRYLPHAQWLERRPRSKPSELPEERSSASGSPRPAPAGPAAGDPSAGRLRVDRERQVVGKGGHDLGHAGGMPGIAPPNPGRHGSDPSPWVRRRGADPAPSGGRRAASTGGRPCSRRCSSGFVVHLSPGPSAPPSDPRRVRGARERRLAERRAVAGQCLGVQLAG